jgi:hypothetical protein
MNTTRHLRWPALTALTLAMAAPTVHADERESLETLRQTTQSLIEVLVENGVISKDKAQAMLKSAQDKAAAALAAQPVVVAPARAATTATTTVDGKPVLRVPYVPESMRNQLRNEIKEEVLAQAKAERWGVPNATPSWVDKIKIDGDFRLRFQSDTVAEDNTKASTYLTSEVGNRNGLSRAPDFASYSVTASGGVIPTASTTDDRSRERIRMRLGVSAKVIDEVGVGIRLATGSATDRVSTNQTLGQNFNKYQLFVDRAFVRVDPSDWLTVQGGRIPNPWFSSDMTWSDNLNFEGMAATVRAPLPLLDATLTPFATVGWFPLREQTPPSRDRRTLVGAQVGAAWDLSPRTRLKFGLALYDYQNLEGKTDPNYLLVTTASSTSTTIAVSAKPNYGLYEYPVGMRQKGNTVFETNPTIDGIDTPPVWGLAYKFRPLVLTASAEFTHFDPFNILLSAEYVNNTAFDTSDFHSRATASAYKDINPGGKRTGYQLKFGVGATEVREAGDWQLQATYRHVGSDAVLDAFTDSDLGLGGTNLQGFTLGLQYGLYRNTTVGLRYLSARSIDTTLNSAYPDAFYKVNSLQVDFNVRF